MGTMAMSKGESKGQVAWSARTNIMYALFDYGRLMIEDEKKIHAFHNEIANLCNQAYENVRKDVEKHEDDEEESFKAHFGYKQRHLEYHEIKKPTSSLYAGLEELLSFMYSDLDVYKGKIDGFIKRAQSIIDLQTDLHYSLSVYQK